MVKIPASVPLLSTLLLSIGASSTAVLAFGNNQSKPKILIGYVGFNGVPRAPQASKVGDLGAVFYAADAVDLARSFAYGSDADKAHICLVLADGAKWRAHPKVWVAASIFDVGGRAVNAAYPGAAVLFAPHSRFGLPKEAPVTVFQLGIRQEQIAALGVALECYAKSVFDGRHDTLDYPSLSTNWGIKMDRRQFLVWE